MLTTEVIMSLSKEQTEQALKEFEQTHDLDKPIVKYTDDIDQLVNILCDLIRRLEILHQEENSEKARDTLRANKKSLVKLPIDIAQ